MDFTFTKTVSVCPCVMEQIIIGAPWSIIPLIKLISKSSLDTAGHQISLQDAKLIAQQIRDRGIVPVYARCDIIAGETFSNIIEAATTIRRRRLDRGKSISIKMSIRLAKSYFQFGNILIADKSTAEASA